MINFGPDFKHKLALSSSKIKTYQHCTQKYWCSYILKLPEKNNAGALKGDIVHSILEQLGINRRKKLVKKISKNGTCRLIPSVWKLIETYAKKHKICVEEELNIIDEYIVAALELEFYGPPGTFEILIEKDFDIEVVDLTSGISFRVRGFFDRIFLRKVRGKLSAVIADFKTNKQRYNKEESQDNIQSNVYQLVFSLLYPEYELESLKFLFLKFKTNPILEAPLLDKGQLKGFQYYLTHLQYCIDNFTEANISDNYGSLKWSTKFLCGPAKSGWICPHQNPLDYYSIRDEKGELVSTGFTKDELIPKLKDGETIKEERYLGCGHFYDKQGNRKN